MGPKFLGKQCSLLVKIISDGENNFTQNKYKKLQKISATNKVFFYKNKCKSANMGSSSVQIRPSMQGVDLIDIQIQNWL